MMKFLAAATLILSACSAYVHAATFDFESIVPNTTTPLGITDGGITATFSSQDGPVFFVGTPPPTAFQNFIGNVLLDDDPSTHALDILFSTPLRSITLVFSLNGPESSLLLTATSGIVVIDSASAMGKLSPGFPFPEGKISFSSSVPFDGIRLTASVQDFAIDNVMAAAIPEPGNARLALAGLVTLIGLVTHRRLVRRRQTGP